MPNFSHLVRARTVNIFILLSFLSVTVLRYPAYLKYPNFYAEDGTVFFRDVVAHPIKSLLLGFNGYPIVGLRIISICALFLSFFLFFHNLTSFVIILSILSYLLWASLGYYTFIVLSKLVNSRFAFLGSLLVVLIPLNGWNYAILGTLGNLKFAFIYFGFLSVVNKLADQKWNLTSFLIFLISVLTNPLVLIFLPLTLLASLDLKLSRNRIDYFLLAPFLIIMIAIFRSVKQTSMPLDYSQGEFTPSQFLEIIVSRTLAFPISSNYYLSLGNLNLIIVSILVSVILFYKYYLSLIILLLCSTISFVIISARHNLIPFFSGYKDSGPAQFFYAQNMIVIFILILFLGKKLSHLDKNKSMIAVLILTLFLASNFRGIGFGFATENYKWHTTFGNIGDNLGKACKISRNTQIKITIMPGFPWTLPLAKEIHCDDKK
jgi:hypothetical protein